MTINVPDGWKNKSISEIATLSYGKSPTGVRNDTGTYPIIGTSGIVGKSNEYIHEGISVIIGRKGTINQPIFVLGKFWAIDTTYYISKFNAVDAKWFYYRVLFEELAKYNEASGVPSLSRDTLNSIQISVPPLPEQQKIASILTSVDDVIEKTQLQINKLQDLKKATMNDLLTKGIGHTEFKDSPIGPIPRDWLVRPIGKIAVINTGKKDTKDRVSFGRHPFYVRSQTIEKIDTYSFDGEAILTAGDGVGTGKVFHYINGKFDFHQRVYKLSEFSSEINGKFLFHYFSLNFIKQVQKFSAKGSVDSVRMEMIAEMNIPVPTLAEQQKIVLTLDSIGTRLDEKKEKLKKIEFLKTSLMQIGAFHL